MKNHLLAITFAACLTAAQPPAPEGRFSALCEIVPAYDLSVRPSGPTLALVRGGEFIRRR